MQEYNIGFSEKLIEAAQVIVKDGLQSVDAKRTVLYLSLLSCESESMSIPSNWRPCPKLACTLSTVVPELYRSPLSRRRREKNIGLSAGIFLTP